MPDIGTGTPGLRPSRDRDRRQAREYGAAAAGLPNVRTTSGSIESDG
jgi:hypothetical protein